MGTHFNPDYPPGVLSSLRSHFSRLFGLLLPYRTPPLPLTGRVRRLRRRKGRR